jgi:hypothetical protein
MKRAMYQGVVVQAVQVKGENAVELSGLVSGSDFFANGGSLTIWGNSSVATSLCVSVRFRKTLDTGGTTTISVPDGDWLLRVGDHIFHLPDDFFRAGFSPCPEGR